jgi:hypothetical protein
MTSPNRIDVHQLRPTRRGWLHGPASMRRTPLEAATRQAIDRANAEKLFSRLA